MPMSINKLKTELINLSLYDNEPDDIKAWALAWKNYFSDSAANGIPIVPSTLTVAEIAMKSAMIGLSIAGAVSLQAGIIAFWGALLPIAFPPCLSLTPPPGISGISALLIPVFVANTVGGLDKPTCCQNVATVLHTSNLGGMAIFPLIPSPLPFPIL